MPTHTPGPWTPDGDQILGPADPEALDYAGEDTDGNRVFHDVVCAQSTMDVDKWAANARLITAAPALLERCIVACDWLADKGVPADHAEMRRLREAIAAAGQPPI